MQTHPVRIWASPSANGWFFSPSRCAVIGASEAVRNFNFICGANILMNFIQSSNNMKYISLLRFSSVGSHCGCFYITRDRMGNDFVWGKLFFSLFLLCNFRLALGFISRNFHFENASWVLFFWIRFGSQRGKPGRRNENSVEKVSSEKLLTVEKTLFKDDEVLMISIQWAVEIVKSLSCDEYEV